MNKTDRDDPSTWSHDRELIDGMVDNLNDEASYSSSGAFLVRQRTSDGAYIVYEAKEVRHD